ncbi:MAG: hypothetical protein RIC55_10825 [Pirellulaceae bacterium]
MYVDLNPIRAGLTDTPECGDFTSTQRRFEARPQQCEEHATAATAEQVSPDDWLAPLPLKESAADPGARTERVSGAVQRPRLSADLVDSSSAAQRTA